MDTRDSIRKNASFEMKNIHDFSFRGLYLKNNKNAHNVCLGRSSGIHYFESTLSIVVVERVIKWNKFKKVDKFESSP